MTDRRGGNAPGHVNWSARAEVADGYLACDGTEHAIADYPDLHRALGSVESSPGMFRVPNFPTTVYGDGVPVGTLTVEAEAGSIGNHVHDMGTLDLSAGAT